MPCDQYCERTPADDPGAIGVASPRDGMKPDRPIKCPTCGQRGNWFAGPFGPFCSRRCKLVDLGKWFGEENKISEPLRPEHLEEYADLPPGDHLDRPES